MVADRGTTAEDDFNVGEQFNCTRSRDRLVECQEVESRGKVRRRMQSPNPYSMQIVDGNLVKYATRG